MAKVYTRTGDTGQTSLANGSRVAKCDVRVDLYGQLDELNSVIGFCVARLHKETPGRSGGSARQLQELVGDLAQLQHTLFSLGNILADPALCEKWAKSGPETFPISGRPLEEKIDTMSVDLEPLNSFILPGGHVGGACLHLARTVCRRVERAAVAAVATTVIPEGAIVFLNRLSDYFFVAARWSNSILGVADVLWQGVPEKE